MPGQSHIPDCKAFGRASQALWTFVPAGMPQCSRTGSVVPAPFKQKSDAEQSNRDMPYIVSMPLSISLPRV
jgi:hypothetical protein